jgi:hypothetical protein
LVLNVYYSSRAATTALDLNVAIGDIAQRETVTMLVIPALSIEIGSAGNGAEEVSESSTLRLLAGGAGLFAGPCTRRRRTGQAATNGDWRR